MKTSIPSDVWEKKRALIAKLYKDEEWPLKQVIKQIRSEDFNPSETQLRSRLKKWRVTKPSRQTRKKSQDTQQESAPGDDSDDYASPKDHASTASPSIQPQSHSRPQSRPQPSSTSQRAAKEEAEWHPMSLEEQDLSKTWIPAHHRDLSPSPSMMHQFPNVLPSSSSYGPSQPSTPVDGVLLNPSSSMAPPSYPTPSYTVAPDACLPQSSAPATLTSVPWSVPPWFSIPLDAVSPQSHSVPFYTTAPPLSPPVPGSANQSIPPSSQIYPPRHHSLPYDEMLSHGMPSSMGDDPRGVERKTSMPAKIPSHPFELVNPSQYFPNGQHPMMCAPIYPYPDQESLSHRPPGIGF